MRRIVLCLVGAGCLTSSLAAFQARSGNASDAQRISACSLITPDIAAKYIHKDIIKFLKPEEAPVGAIGTSCEYGRIGLQVNPFGPKAARSAPGGAKDWQPQAGVGEAAFYRPLNNQYAELIAWTGSHHITIQLGKATGATMETTRTEAIALANAILPRLK